jgi:putative membrane protein
VSSERRLHPVAMLIGAVRTVRRWASAAAIPGIAAFASSGLDPLTVALALLAVCVLVAGSAAWGFLSWRATTYDVSGGAFRLRGGVLQKNERTIPLDHVQSVDTVQGLIQRLFGVVEVRVETAGGGLSEPDARLSALDRRTAELLREEIEGSRRAPVTAEEEGGPAVLRQLGTRELLLAGATSGQIGIALSVVAVISQLFDDLLSETLAERVVETLAPRSVGAALLLILIVATFAWLLAIAGTVLAHSGFTLSRDGDYLYVRRGLLERRETTIPLSRIQAVQVVEGVLRQPLGLAALRVESAGYGADAGVSTMLFPLLPRREAVSLLRAAAPEFAVEAALNPLPRRALRRYVFRSTFPALFLSAAIGVGVLVASGPAILILLAALLPLLAAFYGWLGYRDAGWVFAGDCLISRSRHLARVTSFAPRRRLQSRSVEQSPFQHRVRLATFQVRVASGRGGAQYDIVDVESAVAGELVAALGPRPARKT